MKPFNPGDKDLWSTCIPFGTEKPHKIEKVWMYVSRDENGDEQICGTESPGLRIPVVSAHYDCIKARQRRARDIGEELGKKIVLVCFSNKEDVE